MLFTPLTNTQLGVVRVVLAAALAFTFSDLRIPADPFPREYHLTVHRLADVEWVHALAAEPARVTQLETAILILIALFAIGLATRLSFVALVLALTVWTLVRLTHTGAHNWSVLLVALWAMLPVPWGRALSLDQGVRQTLRPALRGVPLDDRPTLANGWAVWVPGFVFGTAMCAAGIAKLNQAGLDWITNGTVKYHFVSDAATAPTDWGLWVARHHAVAVLLSAGGLLGELAMILPPFLRPGWVRLPCAVLAVSLLGGFYVFQNEVWPAWWTLVLLFYIPWAWLPERPTAGAIVETRVPLRFVLIIAALVSLQVVASVRRIELAPLLSDFPMYSTTYSSIADFERADGGAETYSFVLTFADGSENDATPLVEELILDEPLRDASRVLAQPGVAVDAAAVAVGTRALAQLSAHFDRQVTAIRVLRDREMFNWESGKFEWRERRAPMWTFR